MEDTIETHDQEDVDEAVSLSDFPITNHQTHQTDDDLRTSSEPCGEFFEFFNDLSSEMSLAEDIIFSGKLRPLSQPLSDQTQNARSFGGRRSESLPALNTFQLSELTTPKTQLTRNSRSLDRQKLGRTLSRSSQRSEIHRNSSVKSSERFDHSGQKLGLTKPRWYVLMFGLLKFPPEMELKDMKNRQVRRSPATMFPPFDHHSSRHHGKSSWGLLRVLSCKGNASVAVTPSFGCMPQL
ncbi:hypothetical protein U1Q18_026528 [Sarracenia purpurea var. burkii]